VRPRYVQRTEPDAAPVIAPLPERLLGTGSGERGQGTISDFIPVHLPATNDKAIWRKG
jgi:hypothetical protein